MKGLHPVSFGAERRVLEHSRGAIKRSVSDLFGSAKARKAIPGGAFYAVAELPVQNAERFCQWLLEEFEYNNQTVMIAPAAGFYATKGLGEREVRIAYVLNKDSLNNALDCLEQALKVYPERLVVEVDKMV